VNEIRVVPSDVHEQEGIEMLLFSLDRESVGNIFSCCS